MSELIEQLGGYEQAKRAIENDVLKDYAPYTYETAQRELLEYRRANGIFEPDDLITYNESDFIYKIDTLNRDGLHATTVHQVKRCIIALFGHDNIQHATDEEIKQGRRS